MRFKWLGGYWLTLFFVLSITLYSLWLAWNGRLALYIHPRYITFTVIMSVCALIFVVVDMALRSKLPKLSGKGNLGQLIVGAVCIILCVGLFVAKPTGLTSSAAGQRGINSSALSFSDSSSLADLTDTSVAYDQFTVKEWASLLVQANDITLFEGKTANVTGFVSPAPDDDPNIFYVARFMLTCCAVDARPIGVPVYQPNWRSSYQPDQWLEIKGDFIQNPESNTIPILLNPTEITKIGEPERPYVY